MSDGNRQANDVLRPEAVDKKKAPWKPWKAQSGRYNRKGLRIHFTTVPRKKKGETIMSTTELLTTIKELRELKALAADLQAEITALEDAVKGHMGDQETLRAGEYQITYKTVKSSRLDSKALKRDLPDVAARYTVESAYKRLTVA